MPRRPVALLLCAVLAAALAVRLWGIGFGLPGGYARPDETEVAGPAVGYLSGDLRPPFLQWPSLFSYTVALAYVAYGGAAGPITGHASLAAFAESRYRSIAPFLLLPRALSALMGVVTVWAIFAIGRRRFDDTVALVGATFLSLACLHVRDSHFGLADVPMTALVVCTVLAADRWREGGRRVDAMLAGVLAGLAVSTKYNAGPVVAVLLTAGWQRWRSVRERDARAARHAVLATGLAGVASLVAFALTSPYVLLDWPRFVRDVTTVQGTLAQGYGLTLGRGWFYFARVILPAAVGSGLFALGVAGMAGLLLTRRRETATILAFPLVYYAYAGGSYSVFARYILPVVPFLSLAAGWATVRVVRAVSGGWTSRARAAAVAAAAAVVVAPTAARSVALDRVLAREDNRQVTARGLAPIVTAGSRVYQSGAPYGAVPLDALGVEECAFDPVEGRFGPADPDWVLVQRSPLVLYSAVPETLRRRLRDEYMKVAEFPTEDRPAARLYDQQDAFYVPLAGFDGVVRPGPAFELYRRRAR